MAFQMKSYKELVSMTKEKLDEAMVPLRVRGAKAKAEIKASKLEEEMLELETRINELCAEKDIDIDKLNDRDRKAVEALIRSLEEE